MNTYRKKGFDRILAMLLLILLTAGLLPIQSYSSNTANPGALPAAGQTAPAASAEAAASGSDIAAQTSLSAEHTISRVYGEGEAIGADSQEWTAEQNQTVKAEPEQVFTLNVTYDGNGKVTASPACTGGSIEIVTGTSISIAAKPNEHYRIAKVVKNNTEELLGRETVNDKTANDCQYSDTITDMDQSCTYEITFALQYFTVYVRNVSTATSGSVSLSPAQLLESADFNYGSNAQVYITPADHCRVKSLTVTTPSTTPAGVSIDLKNSTEYAEHPDNTTTYQLTNLTEEQVVEVELEPMQTVDLNSIQITADPGELKNRYTDADGSLAVIYAQGSQAVLLPAAPYTQLSVRYQGREQYEEWQGQVTITDSCTISAIRVRSEKEQNAADLDLGQNKNLRLILDQQAPEVVFIKKEQPNTYGYYNKNITVEFEATDSSGGAASSTITKVAYSVACDTDEEGNGGNQTQAEVLYEVTGNALGTDHYHQAITIEALNHSSDFVALHVTVTDLAGNETTKTEVFKINADAPEIKVKMNRSKKTEAVDGYYEQSTACITIIDRSSTFLPQNVSIDVQAADSDHKTIAAKPKLSQWTTSAGTATGQAVHTATLTFDSDANYKWSLSYENKAGLGREEQIKTEPDDPYVWEFTVDNEPPLLEQSRLTWDKENDKKQWNNLIDTIIKPLKYQYNAFVNHAVSLTADSKDRISPVSKEGIQYYKDQGYEKLNKQQLEQLYKEDQFKENGITVSEDEAFVVYARIMDYAGNVLYISTDGIVADASASAIAILPETPNQHGYHNQDVTVDILVNEKVKEAHKFSGIQSVSYSVKCDGTTTIDNQPLYHYQAAQPTVTVQPKGEITLDPDTNLPEAFSDQIVIDSSKNNGDEIYVFVTVKDNAGNEYTEKSEVIRINTTPPAMTVTFDDQANRLENGYGWYGSPRSAVIEITDRASTFDAENASKGIVIQRTDNAGKTVTLDETTIISWVPDKNDPNQHRAVVTFADDARYEWSISYTNKAGLGLNNSDVKYSGESVSSFTVDKNDPTGRIRVNEHLWDKLLDVLTFGLYSKTQVKVTAEAEDPTSPVTVFYHKTSQAAAFDITQLEQLEASGKLGWQIFPQKGLDISSDEQFVVYLKIEDYAGNKTYISSDGQILDKKESTITLTPQKANEHHAYNKTNKTVSVDVKVEEPGEYSGIQTIEYWIEADGKETKRDTLYSFEYTRDSGHNSNGGQLTITDQSTGETVISQYKDQVPTREQLRKEWTGTILVNTEKNNSSNVVVHVKTKDNAGNSAAKEIPLDIDITPPEISVSYDNNTDNGGNGYFPADRTATIEIRERTNHFNAAEATKGIQITAVDAKGNPVPGVEPGTIISEWTTIKGNTPDDDRHRATITYRTDANYTFAVSYKDQAGNWNQKVDVGNSTAPYRFTIDKSAPSGTITSQTAEGRTDSWNRLVNRRTFGIWSGSRIDIQAAADDPTSPIAQLQYYKTSDPAAKTIEELTHITDWQPFHPLSISANEQFTVYLRIEDLAGNVSYISSDGMIVDNVNPRIEGIAPEVTITPEQPLNGIYNRDVRVDLQVQDPMAGGVYSGLRTISYRVLNMGNETQSGTLFAFEHAAPDQAELQQAWTGSITVDAVLNNSNDVVIELFAEDNSHNSDYHSAAIQIDITRPQILVSYDNNAPDSGSYYKNARTATIVVSERNFEESDVLVTTTRNGEPVELGNSGWTAQIGEGNQDNTTYTTTITYAADGDYTFDIQYTDLAGNTCDSVTYQERTTSSTEFTIDQTDPEIQVSYGEQQHAVNQTFFNTARTAVITVEEHNFDAARIECSIEAFLNGVKIEEPALSDWRSTGDVHTATVEFREDGDYTFQIQMRDKAGRTNSQVRYIGSQPENFTVDTKIEAPKITARAAGQDIPMNGERLAFQDTVAIQVSFADVNYADYEVTLESVTPDTSTAASAVGSVILKNEVKKKSDLQGMFMQDSSQQGGSIHLTDQTNESQTERQSVQTKPDAAENSFEKKKENDGFYRLSVLVSDQAGNRSELSVAEFTLNRFGSLYQPDDYLRTLIEGNGAYVKEVTGDVVITEYNADQLLNGSLELEITRDGQPVEPAIKVNADGSEYTIGKDKFAVGSNGFSADGSFAASEAASVVSGSAFHIGSAENNRSRWYEYIYTIEKDCFVQDGVYKLELSTDNELNKNSKSNYVEQGKDKEVWQFRVDATPPEITSITGLEEKTINATVNNVQYEVYDTIGLASVEVLVNNKTVSKITQFDKDQNHYSGSFDIKERSSAQEVQLIVTDLAGNKTDTSDGNYKSAFAFNRTVTVSTNPFVRWYSNKLLFWSSIACALLVLAAGGTGIFLYRRKKSREEEA